MLNLIDDFTHECPARGRMRMFNKIFIPALVLVNTFVALPTTEAAESNCTQNRVDGTTMPSMASYKHIIRPAQTVVPFYQWENDNGYCGEVSMIQAGLNNGQWMSQFNARLVCGASSQPPNSTGLLQSGPGNWCSTYKNLPNYNAQLLIEDPNSPNRVSVSGPNPYANASAIRYDLPILDGFWQRQLGHRRVPGLHDLGQKRSDCRASSHYRGSCEWWHGSPIRSRGYCHCDRDQSSNRRDL
jgi:hypothetical protein